MRKLDVIVSESFQVDKDLKNIPNSVISTLYKFVAQHYHVTELDEFKHVIIQFNDSGELTILYGINGEVGGFTRTWRQSMIIGTKVVTAYLAYIFLNPDYNAAPTVENAGLTEAIRYKLDHPQEELFYIAFANNPMTYEFVASLSDVYYPRLGQKLPDQMLKIVNALKRENAWHCTNSNSLVVNSPLVPLRSQSNNFDNFDLNEYFTEVNPEYIQGNALLTLIPLHLANIQFGLNYADPKQLCSSNFQQQSDPYSKHIQ